MKCFSVNIRLTINCLSFMLQISTTIYEDGKHQGWKHNTPYRWELSYLAESDCMRSGCHGYDHDCTYFTNEYGENCLGHLFQMIILLSCTVTECINRIYDA